MLFDRNSWKAKCEEDEKKHDEATKTIKRLAEELAAGRAENVSINDRLKNLENFVLVQHEEGFNKVLCQTSLFFDIDVENMHFDIDKDMQDKALVSII